MQIFQCSTDGPNALAEAQSALAAGRLVAIPTETVYGLAADATDGRAVAGIYAAKGRPSFNPLIAHVADLAAAERQGVFDAAARRLAAAFWPGPLTLVVPRAATATVCDLATAGLDTVGLRVPANRLTRALLEQFGRPLAAPSANLSGRISPTTAADVAADLGDRVAVILDDGPCAVGLESTIVACVDGKAALLRPGGVSRAEIERVLGAPLTEAATPDDPHRPQAPGMLASHYAPRARLRLNVAAAGAGEAVLDFAGVLRGQGIAYRDLSPAGDVTEAAAHLFRDLRALDAGGAAIIAVAPVPMSGLGEAINDRLARAAAPR